jgi:hypothetical protein
MVVYFHRNPVSYIVFYVGIGSKKYRAYNFNQGRNPFWRNHVAKYGRPIVQIVHSELSKESAKYWEKFYIKLLGRKSEGGPLVNITEGGDATPIIPPESRKRCNDALVNFIKNNPDKNPSFTPEHSIRMVKNNPMHNPIYVDKVRQANIGKKQSPETRLKNSLHRKGKTLEHLVGYKHSEEMIAKLKIINKEIMSRQEVRDKLRLANTGRICESKRIKVKMIDMHTNDVLRIFSCIKEALSYLGKPTTAGNISAVCRGLRNNTFGYKWEYA